MYFVPVLERKIVLKSVLMHLKCHEHFANSYLQVLLMITRKEALQLTIKWCIFENKISHHWDRLDHKEQYCAI